MEPLLPLKSYGQVAYEGYGEAVDWKNYLGGFMPKWEDLPARIKDAWQRAADDVNFERDMRR